MNTKQATDAPAASKDNLDSLHDDAGIGRWAPRLAGDRQGVLLIGFLIWICALPFIAWFFVPRFGTVAGVWASAVALGLTLAICSFIAISHRR